MVVALERGRLERLAEETQRGPPAGVRDQRVVGDVVVVIERQRTGAKDRPVDRGHDGADDGSVGGCVCSIETTHAATLAAWRPPSLRARVSLKGVGRQASTSKRK